MIRLRDTAQQDLATVGQMLVGRKLGKPAFQPAAMTIEEVGDLAVLQAGRDRHLQGPGRPGSMRSVIRVARGLLRTTRGISRPLTSSTRLDVVGVFVRAGFCRKENMVSF